MAFAACFLGIATGDFGLFVLGRIAHSSKWLNQFSMIRGARKFLDRWKDQSEMSAAIVISRAIPGTRIPTYIGAGLVGYPMGKFLTLTFLSVGGWVLIAFLGGRSLQLAFSEHWILSVLGVLLVLGAARKWLPEFANKWRRKALLHSWRKWLSFEFWPATIFYLPIVPIYILQSLKTGSFFNPFFANPELLNGGLIGESKWDFLKHLSSKDPATLATLLALHPVDPKLLEQKLEENNLEFPLVAKPDVGQRGFGVRILKKADDLYDYLKEAHFDLIFQKLSQFKGEAGIFYYRMPGVSNGQIFSITDKRFPTVVGNGIDKLGDLILRDPRARIIAGVYFERHWQILDSVLEKNRTFPLSECGNHCQGAIFLNGNAMRTPDLEKEIDRIAKTIPHFYFGRFDVRYENPEQLMKGKNFEIVEVNGAGSEATHIWDARTGLFEAYSVLFQQWTILFSVGKEAKRLHTDLAKVHFFRFLRDSYKVFVRKERLSVSS